MSTYIVKLSEWFPYTDQMHSSALLVVKSLRCNSCGKKVRWKAAIGHHSLPWSHGDLYCSWKCADSDKVAKLDWRRERRIKRKYGKYYTFTNVPGEMNPKPGIEVHIDSNDGPNAVSSKVKAALEKDKQST